MDTDLQASCSALGYHEGNRYIKEPDCLETVRELIRFLRREDDTCDVRRQLGHAQILQKDLLPIVKQYHTDKPLFDTLIRLLVNLTQPVIVCFNNQLPEEKTLRQFCLEIESHLQLYKEAFVDEELFKVLTKKITELLQLDWEHRHEEDKLMLERLLVLVRNVLHIPPDPATEQRTDDDASLHDQILWAIHVSGLEDLLLYVASADNERELCMHILEIVSLMYREHSPQVLAFAGVQRSMTEKEKDERELEMATLKEKAQKKQKMLRFNTRHSNFGGTYVMMNTKSLSENDLIYHQTLQEADNFTLDSNKKPRKKPKNRQPIKDKPVVRRSTLSIRLGLKEFCVQFLENAYNPLMCAVKNNLNREAAEDLDETYYLWSMQFFMEFCRHHSSHVDFVSETMSVTTFHYIYNNLLRYYEMIMVEKKEAVVWGRRVHLALRAYQELLMTLDMMDRSSNSHLRDSARVIKSNVFYMMEFRDVFIQLLKKFNESKNSRTYLKDLVETTHLFVRMLEKYTKGNNRLVVKGKNCRKTKKAAKKGRRPKEPTEQQLEDVWQEVSSDLSAMLQGREEVPQDVAPFDAASEVDVDQQRVDAMVRIQSSLRQKQTGEAVAIFRAAREVWPERDEFGSQEITPEEEFMALREIFMAPLPGSNTNQEEVEEIPVEEEELDEEEEMTAQRTDFEEEFNFTAYIMNYAKPEILQAYVLLAADFETNSAHTNHCVVKMLHRIGFDMDFIGMLFQASLFRVFQKLLLGPLASSSRFKEMRTFGMHVIRKFSEVAQKNKKVFMEMLFWKGSKEAMQITEGYDYNPGKAKVAWTENDENELMRLFEDFKDIHNPEKDTVDMILGQWSGENKTRGQIIRQLKNLHLIESAKDLRRKPESSHAWTADDEQELEQSYFEYKDTDDPLYNIINALSKTRSRAKVTEKLLALGIVTDRKQLHKKRRGKSGGRKSRRGRDRGDSGGEESDSGDADKPTEGNLPSDEEILSSPTASEASSEDGDDDNDGDNDDGATGEGTSHQLENGDPTNTSMVDTVKNLVENGYMKSVQWIQRVLDRTAKNREGQEKYFPVPVVPLREEDETAMDDPVFTNFLEKLGVTAPSSEQETFWRIPAHFTVADLKTISKAIELDDDSQIVNPDALSQLPSSSRKLSSKDKQKKKKAKQKKKDDKKTRHKNKEEKMKKKKKKAEKKERRTGREKQRKEERIEDTDDDDENLNPDKSDGDGSDNDDNRTEKGDKMSGAAQRRDALKAMLERRKVKKITNRNRKRPDDSSEEQPLPDTGNEVPAEISHMDASPSPDVTLTLPSSNKKSRKRVKQAVASDSDSDGNVETMDVDEGKEDDDTPAKPPKRIRLLDSDSDNHEDDDKENLDKSLVNYNSDEGTKFSQSQSQSQGLLDFGDSDDDDEDTSGNAKQANNSHSMDNDNDDDDDDDVPLTAIAKRKAEELDSFPATHLPQGPPHSDDSDSDDHTSLSTSKKRRIISDDEDE